MLYEFEDFAVSYKMNLYDFLLIIKKFVKFHLNTEVTKFSVYGVRNEVSQFFYRALCAQLSDARLVSATRSDEQRELRSLGQHATYFQWENGRVVRVFVSDDDSTFAANIKKGIIDMFQLRLTDGQHSEVRQIYFC